MAAVGARLRMASLSPCVPAFGAESPQGVLCAPCNWALCLGALAMGTALPAGNTGMLVTGGVVSQTTGVLGYRSWGAFFSMSQVCLHDLRGTERVDKRGSPQSAAVQGKVQKTLTEMSGIAQDRKLHAVTNFRVEKGNVSQQ